MDSEVTQPQSNLVKAFTEALSEEADLANLTSPRKVKLEDNINMIIMLLALNKYNIS